MNLHEKVQFYHSLRFNQDETLQFLSEFNNVVISKRHLPEFLLCSVVQKKIVIARSGFNPRMKTWTADLQCIQSVILWPKKTVRRLLQIIHLQGCSYDIQVNKDGRYISSLVRSSFGTSILKQSLRYLYQRLYRWIFQAHYLARGLFDE